MTTDHNRARALRRAYPQRQRLQPTPTPMKFQPDRSNAQTISGYGPGWIG
ncbi:MAG: hypothetical protein IV104_01400, partial [Acidovorax sp.]|nr:hypothetical protein [Acidovorax sp.]